jgi:methyl-accepting chemotaxis protein
VNEQTPTLEELAAELESVADKLRSEAIDADEGADLVERCAELAQRIGAEIDARGRSAGETEGQERLL